MNTTAGQYNALQRRTVAEVPGLRVRQLALSAAQEVPWHRHTATIDTFFCMSGPMVVGTYGPCGSTELLPGGRIRS
jgi:quercetin dioxygenase-like cupin family protein